MHPNAFLNTYWRLEVRDTIFVAMSFAPRFKKRFDEVIAPAIESIKIDGNTLRALRVDLSKTGDSILTDILDGISHSRMVLADVSTIGHDSVSGDAYRSGNVMYEVGIALACRRPHEVLLLRSDRDKFLFDVSTVPHMNIDFSDADAARSILKEELEARLQVQSFESDARVQIAVAGLTSKEAKILKEIASMNEGHVWASSGESGFVDFNDIAAIPRLLDKGLIKCAARFNDSTKLAYAITPLGRVVSESWTKLHIVGPKQTTSTSA